MEGAFLFISALTSLFISALTSLLNSALTSLFIDDDDDDDCFYIALFSALEQTHGARM